MKRQVNMVLIRDGAGGPAGIVEGRAMVWRPRGVAGGGGGGSLPNPGREGDYIPIATTTLSPPEKVTPQYIKMGSNESHFNVSFNCACGRTKSQESQCPQTTLTVLLKD